MSRGERAIRPFVIGRKNWLFGYTKMLVANKGYKIQHKNRNVLSWCPTDKAADTMMKRHVETMIRDVPVVRALAPWIGRKHRDNTLDEKRFDNGKMLWCLGGKAAQNYREKSADEVIYDELSKFDPDIEGEGAPTTLGDKRLEGATFPKSIRGSTPGTIVGGAEDDDTVGKRRRAGRSASGAYRSAHSPEQDRRRVGRQGALGGVQPLNRRGSL